jgi:TrwC relaxase
MALPVKALKAGQEAYWLDQIAKNREEYFSGKGESPGRFVGSVAAASGLAGEATPEQVRRQVQAARAEALAVAVGYLEQHGVGVRRDHNGTDRYPAQGGLLGVAFEHRVSRAGDPQYHTHVLVQNAATGPDGRWTAVDSDRLYAHLMAADHLYLAAERAALTERLGVRWTPVDARSGAAEVVGLDDRTLLQRFSKRSEQIDDWLAEHGLAGIKASSAAAVATRAPKDHTEDEQSVYARWTRELADAGIGERELGAALGGVRDRLQAVHRPPPADPGRPRLAQPLPLGRAAPHGPQRGPRGRDDPWCAGDPAAVRARRQHPMGRPARPRRGDPARRQALQRARRRRGVVRRAGRGARGDRTGPPAPGQLSLRSMVGIGV